MSALFGSDEGPHCCGVWTFVLLGLCVEMDWGECWTGGVSYLSWEVWTGGTFTTCWVIFMGMLCYMEFCGVGVIVIPSDLLEDPC
jgi:hypothetical protein